MAFRVRPARKKDLQALGKMGGALARQHHGFDGGRFMLPEDPEGGYAWWLGRELGNKKAVVLVADDDSLGVVGYAYGTIEGRDWNQLLDQHGGFHDVWVEEKVRGRGIGAALASGLYERLVELGAPRVVLYTAAKNAAAQKMFGKLGWRVTMFEMTRDAE